MSIAVLDGSTVLAFVEDKGVFDESVNEYFEKLGDVTRNGGLSRNVFRNRFYRFFEVEDESQSMEEIDRLYNNMFEKFDLDRNGNIDCSEFRSLMKEIMLAMARGIGDSLVLVAFDQDSLLNKALQYESAPKNF